MNDFLRVGQILIRADFRFSFERPAQRDRPGSGAAATGPILAYTGQVLRLWPDPDAPPPNPPPPPPPRPPPPPPPLGG